MRTADLVTSKGFMAAMAVLAVAVQAHAGRPLVVDDADPVERGRVEVEFGIEVETDANAKTWAAPLTIASGITEWIEVGIGTTALYVNDEEASPQRVAGIGDVVIAAKARLPILPFGIKLALAPFLKIPTADEDRGLGTGELDGGGLLILTREFTDTQKLHFNAGYTVVGDVPEQRLKDVLFVGIASETSVPGLAEERFQVVAEFFATTEEEADGRGDIQGRLGVRYGLIEDLVLDAAIGRSLTAHPAVEFFATAGLTWTFDVPGTRREAKRRILRDFREVKWQFSRPTGERPRQATSRGMQR
ncbi:MAG TPA: transporter [Alphaproteobacteria bacterium]|nr:transporter [Alphaproteobacteria bacterium]